MHSNSKIAIVWQSVALIFNSRASKSLLIAALEQRTPATILKFGNDIEAMT